MAFATRYSFEFILFATSISKPKNFLEKSTFNSSRSTWNLHELLGRSAVFHAFCLSECETAIHPCDGEHFRCASSLEKTKILPRVPQRNAHLSWRLPECCYTALHHLPCFLIPWARWRSVIHLPNGKNTYKCEMVSCSCKGKGIAQG